MLKILNSILYKSYRELEYYDINYDELLQKQKQGAVIIDVRSEQEYNEGHIENAILIPKYKVNKMIESIVLDKNQEIVIYCTSGIRSKKVCENLIKMGYKNIFNLYLGLDNINY